MNGPADAPKASTKAVPVSAPRNSWPSAPTEISPRRAGSAVASAHSRIGAALHQRLGQRVAAAEGALATWRGTPAGRPAEQQEEQAAQRQEQGGEQQQEAQQRRHRRRDRRPASRTVAPHDGRQRPTCRANIKRPHACATGAAAARPSSRPRTVRGGLGPRDAARSRRPCWSTAMRSACSSSRSRSSQIQTTAAPVRGGRLQPLHHRAGGRQVQAHGRIAGDHQFGRAGQLARHHQLLQVAARERTRPQVGSRGPHVEPLEQLAGARAPRPGRQERQAARVQRRQVRQQRQLGARNRSAAAARAMYADRRRRRRGRRPPRWPSSSTSPRRGRATPASSRPSSS